MTVAPDEPRALTRPAAPTAGTGLRDALHAEWIKLRTAPGTFWLVFAATRCRATGCGQDPAKVSLTGIYLGQVAVAMVAVPAISGEYSSGMIRTTLAAMPHRITVLAAKAALLTGLMLAAGALAVLGSLLAGRFILPGHGFTVAHGFAALSLADGPVCAPPPGRCSISP